MKRLAIITALLALSACETSEQMAARAKSECDQIGYAVGSPEYIACTERGYRQIDSQQDAAAGAATGAILAAILLNAYY